MPREVCHVTEVVTGHVAVESAGGLSHVIAELAVAVDVANELAVAVDVRNKACVMGGAAGSHTGYALTPGVTQNDATELLPGHPIRSATTRR